MAAATCPALPCSEAAQGRGYLLSKANSRSQASWRYCHCWNPRPLSGPIQKSLDRLQRATKVFPVVVRLKTDSVPPVV